MGSLLLDLYLGLPGKTFRFVHGGEDVCGACGVHVQAAYS